MSSLELETFFLCHSHFRLTHNRLSFLMIIELKIIVDCSTFSQWLAVIELEFSYGSIDTWEVYVVGRCVWGENQRLELFPPYDLRQFFTATIFHHYFPHLQALLALPEGNLIPVPNCRLSHSPLTPHNIDLNSHFTCVSRSSLSLSSSSSRATVRLGRLYCVSHLQTRIDFVFFFFFRNIIFQSILPFTL